MNYKRLDTKWIILGKMFPFFSIHCARTYCRLKWWCFSQCQWPITLHILFYISTVNSYIIKLLGQCVSFLSTYLKQCSLETVKQCSLTLNGCAENPSRCVKILFTKTRIQVPSMKPHKGALAPSCDPFMPLQSPARTIICFRFTIISSCAQTRMDNMLQFMKLIGQLKVSRR